MLVFVISCSSDDNINKSSTNEKKVVELFETFSKSVVNSPEYNKFIEKVQTKTSSELTEEEKQQLEQEFLSQQSAEFVALYYYVVDLNLSKEELRNIILDYFSLIDKTETQGKDSGSDCTISSALGGSSGLLTWLAELACECNCV